MSGTTPRRFRFSLAGLMLAIVVVAIGCVLLRWGWGVLNAIGESEWRIARVKGLKDTRPWERLESARALGRRGSRARYAVPALLEGLSDEDEDVRSAVADALKRIDPEAAAEAGVP
jgi:hypothetical protein